MKPRTLLALLLLAAPLAAQDAFRSRPTAGVGYQSGFTGPDCWPGNQILPEPAGNACIVARYGHNNGCPPSGQPFTWVGTHYCAEKEDWNAVILHHACLAGEFGPGHGECEPTALEVTDLEQTAIRGSAWACQHLMPGLRGAGGLGLTPENPEPAAYPVGAPKFGARKRSDGTWTSSWSAGLQQETEPASGCRIYYFNTPGAEIPVPVPPPVTPPPPPKPACPPIPVCQSVPPEVRTELQAALDRLAPFRYKLRARVRAAIAALDAYKPCVSSTGQNAMEIR